MSSEALNEVEIRIQKIEKAREQQIIPFAERFEINYSISAAAELEPGTRQIRLAGRIIALRYFGKLAFGHISDLNGKIQFALQKNRLNESFSQFQKLIDIGDFIGFEGELMVTRTGEKTIDIHSWCLLSKAIRPLPEKFHGLTDAEQKLRKRYLDLITNEESRERFIRRNRIIKSIRNFLDAHDFMEIDTPVLSNKASGAIATPFITHHNALDIDIYLRIAPETYLKRAVAGGLNRVYEFARCFRNEGMDPSHLPDFTLLEYYCAYWNYEDNMAFTEKLIKNLLMEVNGSYVVKYQDTTIDFGNDWPRISFRDLILKDAGIDIDLCATAADLLAAVDGKGITFEDGIELKKLSRGAIIDLLYKKVSRPALINPVFIIKHPVDISPLARRNDHTANIVDRFQLVVKGWEIVNAYSELIDPIDQKQRFLEQAAARERGDTEAMEIDHDFIECMEYGMPPMSGWGMGIDRLVALLTNALTLRDVVLFPLMRPAGE